MLFRDQVAGERAWPRTRYIAGSALIVAMLAALAVFTTYDRRIAAFFLAAAAVVFLLLRLTARVSCGLRRMRRARNRLCCGSRSPICIAPVP